MELVNGSVGRRCGTIVVVTEYRVGRDGSAAGVSQNHITSHPFYKFFYNLG